MTIRNVAEPCSVECCDLQDVAHVHGGTDDEAERISDAVEHFLDPEAGAYGHEDRDGCGRVLMELAGWEVVDA